MASEEFDAGYVARLQAVADHGWTQGMRAVGEAVLGDVGTGLRVLDAGCGAGTNLGWLARFAAPGHLDAIDVAAPAVARSHDPGTGARADVLQASVAALPFRDGSFDLVVSLDVLQHLTAADEASAVAETVRVLRPGGRVLVRTNAAFGPAAAQERDDWRVYRPDRLRQALAGGGLEVERVTPVNAVLGGWSSLRRRTPGGHDHGHGIPPPAPPWRDALARRLLGAEAAWLRGGRRGQGRGRVLPFGHSLYAVARRPPA